MVEQDLIITRALISLYSNPDISDSLVFRGGTALNKLYLNPPSRYSEDIDLVQIKHGSIGKTIDAIRNVLDPWLKQPKRIQTKISTKLIYKFESINKTPAKLKIEINTKEHFHVLKLKEIDCSMNSEWFTGTAKILTYKLEELIATKLRALYQRRKGRDLFDLWLVLKQDLINVKEVISIFESYCNHNNQIIPRALFEKNLAQKRNHKDFAVDIKPLLAQEANWDPAEAFELINEKFISRL